MRVCRWCKIEKPMSGFSLRNNGTSYRTECKSCLSEWMRKYRSENKERHRNLEAARSYNITTEEANDLYKQTHCQICDNKLDKTGYIDHCHKSGKIRGVLCVQCNFGLGYFKDDINIMNKAILYLKENT